MIFERVLVLRNLLNISNDTLFYFSLYLRMNSISCVTSATRGLTSSSCASASSAPLPSRTSVKNGCRRSDAVVRSHLCCWWAPSATYGKTSRSSSNWHGAESNPSWKRTPAPWRTKQERQPTQNAPLSHRKTLRRCLTPPSPSGSDTPTEDPDESGRSTVLLIK